MRGGYWGIVSALSFWGLAGACVPGGGGGGAGVGAGAGDAPGINQAPTAQVLSVTVTKNTPKAFTLVASDPEGDRLEFFIAMQPVRGSLQGSGSELVYVPQSNFTGADQFSFRVSDGVNQSEVATVSVIVVSWVAPLGIPNPSFGIEETVENIYGSDAYFTHYVDNTHPNATNTSNPNGSPSRPRLSVPNILAAGSVVEVHGGPYVGSGYIPISGQGTIAAPIFIRGRGANRPTFDHKISVYQDGNDLFESRYMIFENLDLKKWEVVSPCNYVALRNSEVHNGGGMAVTGRNGAPAKNVVIYNSISHDNGEWLANFDQDTMGLIIGSNAQYVWAVDSEFYHNSGNGVMCNPNDVNLQPFTHHIYIGRNDSHHNKQAAFASKQATDIIFSQNRAHDQRPIGFHPSDYGPGIGAQYGPERIWFLANHVYNCSIGIAIGSRSGLGTGRDAYFIGNLIHSVHYFQYNLNESSSPDDNSVTGSAGITPGGDNKYIIGNTIYDVDNGINGPSGASGWHQINNIVANISHPLAYHTFIGDGFSGGEVRSNLFFQSDRNIRLRGAGTTYSSISQFQAGTGLGQNCLSADPLFKNVPEFCVRIPFKTQNFTGLSLGQTNTPSGTRTTVTSSSVNFETLGVIPNDQVDILSTGSGLTCVGNPCKGLRVETVSGNTLVLDDDVTNESVPNFQVDCTIWYYPRTSNDLYLDDVSRFSVGDKVEYNNDGIVRTIQSIDAGTKKLVISPAISGEVAAAYSVCNWKTKTNFVLDFSLMTGSPAIDSGVAPEVFDTFEALYGVDIQNDIAGNARPQGNGCDMGAYESR